MCLFGFFFAWWCVNVVLFKHHFSESCVNVSISQKESSCPHPIPSAAAHKRWHQQAAPVCASTDSHSPQTVGEAESQFGSLFPLTATRWCILPYPACCCRGKLHWKGSQWVLAHLHTFMSTLKIRMLQDKLVQMEPSDHDEKRLRRKLKPLLLAPCCWSARSSAELHY